MHDTLTPYRTRLLQSKFYSAGPVFVQSVRWQYDNHGHVLVDVSTGGNVVAAVVGRVLEHRLCCGPNGNYLDPDSEYATLASAKFQLQLGRPIGTPFELDYDKVLENVASIQAQTASTNDRRNFIVTDGTNRNLRFTRKIFNKRDHIIARPPEVNVQYPTEAHLKNEECDVGDLLDDCEKENVCPDGQVNEDDDVYESLSDTSSDTAISPVEEEIEQVDEETEHWPVPPRFREELDNIKFEYCAVPLAVYSNDKFVEPADVNNIVSGALVELHFELHHYCFRKKGQDSFNASIEQIIVLRPGDPRPTSPYKRKNPRDGPIRLNPNVPLQKRVSSSTSTRAAPDKEDQGHSMSEKRRGKQKAKPKETENELKETENELKDDVMNVKD